MKASATNLLAALTVGMAALAASSASAGGFKVSFGGGHGHKQHHHGHHHHHHHGHHHHKFHHYPVKKYYAPIFVYDKCYHPFYSYCFVYPGDTWYTIAKRCYGHSHLWRHIATYNNLGLNNSVLTPGQQLQLPVINANGTLTASNAPVPAPFVPQNVAPLVSPPAAASVQPTELQVPAASIRPIVNEPKRPVASMASMLAVDADSLGSEKGSVRLRLRGMTLPVEVLEWADSSVKIKLPAVELTESIAAELEVLRADGTLASKSALELIPAATRLALEN